MNVSYLYEQLVGPITPKKQQYRKTMLGNISHVGLAQRNPT